MYPISLFSHPQPTIRIRPYLISPGRSNFFNIPFHFPENVVFIRCRRWDHQTLTQEWNTSSIGGMNSRCQHCFVQSNKRLHMHNAHKDIKNSQVHNGYLQVSANHVAHRMRQWHNPKIAPGNLHGRKILWHYSVSLNNPTHQVQSLSTFPLSNGSPSYQLGRTRGHYLDTFAAEKCWDSCVSPSNPPPSSISYFSWSSSQY